MAVILVSNYGTSTANVQAAVTAAKGGTCIFQAGTTYSITSDIVVSANTRLEGNGCTLKYPNSSTTSSSHSSTFFDIQGSQVIMYGFTFDGNNTNQGATWSPYRHCVRASGSYSNIVIRENTFTNIIGDGVYTNTQKGGNIHVLYNTFTANNNNRNGVTIASGTNVRVRYNTFTKMSRSDQAGAVNIEAAAQTDVLQNLYVHDNTIDGGSTAGDSLESGIVYTGTNNAAANSVQIYNNDIFGTRINSAITIQGQTAGPSNYASGLSVTSNNIHNIAASGYGVQLRDWISCDSISSNTFNGMAYGIYNYKGCTSTTTMTGNTYTSVTNGSTVGSTTPQCPVNVVTTYGADSTGATDSTTAFQNALDAISAAGVGTLLVPPGTYRTNAFLQIKPPGNILISMYGATIQLADNADGVTIFKNYSSSTNYPVFTGPSNIAFRGGTLDSNALGTIYGSQGISIAHSSNLLIEDVVCQNVSGGHGVEVNSTQHAIVRNCTFKGFVITTNNYDEALQIDGAFTSATIGSAPWDYTTCDDVLVSGCTVSGNGSLYSWGSLTGSHTGREDHPHTNITVRDNVINDTIHYGIKVMDWRNATISNNVFNNCNGGVDVIVRDDCLPIDASNTLTQYVNITGNVFNNSGDNPYSHVGPLSYVIRVHGLVPPYSQADDIVIDGNVINGYENPWAIMAEQTDRLQITHNQILNPVYTSQVPILVQDSDSPTISNNVLTAGTTTYIDTTSNVTNLSQISNSTTLISTIDEPMPIVTFAEDLTDRTTTSNTYVDVSALSCNIVCPASRKVRITIQARQSSSASFVATSFRIAEGATTVLTETDDRCAQSQNVGDLTAMCQYVADFSTLNGGTVAAGDTVTVTLKHRVATGATGTLRYRNIMLEAVN